MKTEDHNSENTPQEKRISKLLSPGFILYFLKGFWIETLIIAYVIGAILSVVF